MRVSAPSSHLELSAVALELAAHLPSMQTAAATARRANVAGETVSASERVFSLFEPHTELIKRAAAEAGGVRSQSTVVWTEKFITDDEVYEEQQLD